MGPLFIIGQVLGGVAIILGFLSYQVKTQKQLLFLQALTTAVFSAHYALIGAYSGMAMNLVGLVRNFTYRIYNEKNGTPPALPIAFAVAQAILCALTWEAWYSVFVLFGLVINTLCLAFRNPNNVRKSILVTSPLVLIYDALAGSWGGAIYESVAIISSVIGIVRNRKSATPHADEEKQ